MKFVCEHCRTQYLISDDKIGPRGVKVCCKRCSNVILLQSDGSSTSLNEQRQTPGNGRSGNLSGASPTTLEQSETEQDELGQVFDKLLKAGRDWQDSGDGEINSSDVTEIFDPEDLKRLQSQMGPLDEESEKIDQIFALAESTNISLGEVEKQNKLKKQWYIAFEGQQLGPLSLQELESRLKEGLIDSRTYAWRQGMPDWLVMQNVSELRCLFDGTGKEIDLRVGGSPTNDVSKDQGLLQRQWSVSSNQSTLSDLVQKELQAVKNSAVDGAAQIPESDHSYVTGSTLDENPWVEGDKRGGGGEGSGFFDSTQEQTDSYTVGTEGSQDSAFLDRQLARPAYLSDGAKHRTVKRWLVVGFLLVALVVLGGVAYRYVLNDELPFGSSEEANLSRLRKEQAGRVRLPPSQDQKTLAEVDGRPGELVDGSKGNRNQPDDSKDKGGEKGNTPKTSQSKSMLATTSAKIERPKARATTSRPVGDRPAQIKKNRAKREQNQKKQLAKQQQGATPKNRKGSGYDSQGLQKTLSKDQIYDVMKRSIPAMKGCVKQQLQRDPSVKGTLLVSFVIKPTGGAGTVTILSKEHSGTYVSECISYIIKEMKFPKFSGKPITVPKVPLTIGK